MVQRLHTDRGLTRVTLTPMFCRETILGLNEYECVSSNRYVHKTKNFSAYSYEYYSPPARLFARAPKPKFSDAALRLIASKPPLKMWVVKKI